MTAQEAQSLMIYIEQLEAQLMAMKNSILEMAQTETIPSDSLNGQDAPIAT